MSNVRSFDPAPRADAARTDADRPHRRRAEDVLPPGRRTGRGANSILPYLAQTIAASPNAGPPGGVERRSRSRRSAIAARVAAGADDSSLGREVLKIRPMAQRTSDTAFEAWKQAEARARDYEAQLAEAWKAYDQLGAAAPDAQLVAEVALFREVAQKRLSELLQLMKASNAAPDFSLGLGGDAQAA